MGDRELRELGRRFQESKDPADEGRWLHARLLAGDLERGPLVIAAFMGHRPAREVLGLAKTELAVTGLDLTPLREELSGDEYEAVWLRAAAGALRAAFARWREEEFLVPLAALAAAEGWIVCPCEECAAELPTWAERCSAWKDPARPNRDTLRQVYAAGVQCLCQAILTSAQGRLDLLERALISATYKTRYMTHRHSRFEREDDPRHLRMAWRRELPPWALGIRDPLRERGAKPREG